MQQSRGVLDAKGERTSNMTKKDKYICLNIPKYTMNKLVFVMMALLLVVPGSALACLDDFEDLSRTQINATLNNGLPLCSDPEFTTGLCYDEGDPTDPEPSKQNLTDTCHALIPECGWEDDIPEPRNIERSTVEDTENETDEPEIIDESEDLDPGAQIEEEEEETT